MGEKKGATRAPWSPPPSRSGSLLQLIQNAWILQSRNVLRDLLALGEGPQQAAHDLARTGLRQVLAETDFLGLGDRTDLLADPVAQIVGNLLGLFAGRAGLLQHHEGADGLAGQV